MGFFKKKKKKEPPYLWVIPRTAQLLPDYPQGMTGQIFDGEAIAKFITLAGFPCKLEKTTVGASVATYHISLVDVMKIKKARNAIIDPLEAHLNCKITLGDSDTSHFSLTIPRSQRDTVHLGNVLKSREFMSVTKNSSTDSTYNASVPMALGTDAEGRALCVDLATLPHMIVSGTTGSGKSVLVNSMITSSLFGKAPSQLKYVLIDPKQSEFFQFESIPHLYKPVITDVREAINTLDEMCRLMEQRSAQLAAMGKRDIEGTQFCRIVIVIDELADIIMSSKRQVEDYIVRLSQRGRSCGLHLILATQSPRSSVLTGLIRQNISTKVALRCSTAIDSRIAIGKSMAERLLDKGDGIIQGLPGDIREHRFQAAWISPDDINKVTHYWQHNAKEYQQ
jgi:S-DNA-T family DNA segregation ATPase FtsK/SpoIIIE